jgi:hypothetical protein
MEELNKTYHILTEGRRHSNTLDVRSFRIADYDTDHYLVAVTNHVGNINVTKVTRFQRTVRTRISKTCREGYINLRGVTDLEVI